MSPLSDRYFAHIFSQEENFLCGFSFHFCLLETSICVYVCARVLICFDEGFFVFEVWSTDLLTKIVSHGVEANTAN